MGELRQNVQLAPSVEWNGTIDVLGVYRIAVSGQGHVEVEVEGRKVIDIDSPDRIVDQVSTKIGLGKKQVVVRFWQKPGKLARLQVTSRDVFPVPDVFAAEGEVEVSPLPEAPQVQFASSTSSLPRTRLKLRRPIKSASSTTTSMPTWMLLCRAISPPRRLPWRGSTQTAERASLMGSRQRLISCSWRPPAPSRSSSCSRMAWRTSAMAAKRRCGPRP